jgi:zinc transporter ZupT
MSKIVDLQKDPYGLGTGILLSGSITLGSLVGYCYYPIATSTAVLVTPNISGSGTGISQSFSAGVPIYAYITQVSQSNGYAILYNSQENGQ